MFPERRFLEFRGVQAMTRVKIAFMNLVIALGSVAIIWVQWPEAMKPRGYGGGYEQSFSASMGSK